MRLSTVVRLTLTALLTVGVYFETGVFTAIAVGLLAGSNELAALAVKNLTERVP